MCMGEKRFSALVSQDAFKDKAFRQAASKLSFVRARAKKDADGKVVGWGWQFDLSKTVEEEEINALLHGFDDADVKRFLGMVRKVYQKDEPSRASTDASLEAASAALSFDEFIRSCAKSIQCTNMTYTVQGDLVDGFCYPNERDDTFSVFDLMAGHNTRRKVQVIVTGKTVIDTGTEKKARKDIEIDPMEFVGRFSDSTVEVTGLLRFYQGKAAISLWAKEIRWLDVSSRLREREDAIRTYHDQFKTEEQQAQFGLSRVERIAVITGGTEEAPCQGAVDFDNKIYRKSGVKIDYAYINSNDVREVIQQIDALDTAGTYDAICIVRGGGDKEELCQYSSPALLDAIHRAKTPIVTGIGHMNDDLLCNWMADYDAGTPTGAANFINRESNRVRKAADKQKNTLERARTGKNHVSLLEEKEYLLAEIEELQGEIARLKVENDKLRSLKGKSGFFQRLFSRF